MKCWLGLADVETKEGSIQRFNDCFAVAFCVDQFCNIMGPTEQTCLGEVSSVDMKKITRVVRWLRVNCKHPQLDMIVNHLCAVADADVKVFLSNEVKAYALAEFEKMQTNQNSREPPSLGENNLKLNRGETNDQ